MGLRILVPIVLVLVAFPQLFIAMFSVDDPVMLESLPFAIRIVCINALFTFTNDSMVNFLSATEREKLANISYAIQIVVKVLLMRLINYSCAAMMWTNFIKNLKPTVMLLSSEDTFLSDRRRLKGTFV